MPRDNNIKVRRGAKESWDTANPILDQGEFGFDTTQNLLKIGNGVDNWHDLSILAQANPLLLSSESIFTSKLSIRSPIIDFTLVDDVEILTVPHGYMFSIDAMEILTVSITSPGSAPVIRFGNELDFASYYAPTATRSNSRGSRHIIENPQDAIYAETAITFGVTIPSGATEHTGCSIISGHLVKIS